MKFKVTDTCRLRATPSLEGTVIGSVEAGTIIESDEHTWKAVTLPDGRKGYCAASFLTPVPEPPPPQKGKWFAPIRVDKFKVTQKFLTPDPLYKITGHHPGTDYGTQGADNVELYFCADGEVIESGSHNAFGNYFFFYVPEVDRTFVYFHLRDTAPAKGQYQAGKVCGITGKTGLSQGIHLHLECIKGRKTSADRAKLFISKAALATAAEDADVYIRAKLAMI